MVPVYNADMDPQTPTPKPNHIRIARPTPEEVRRAHRQITEDGIESEYPNLSLLAALDPVVKEAVELHSQNAIRLGLVGKLLVTGGDSFNTVHALASGAILWGIHLGLHIGQNRAAVWPRPNPEDPTYAAQRFHLPNYCSDCGVRLKGGATQHTPQCPIKAIIDQAGKPSS